MSSIYVLTFSRPRPLGCISVGMEKIETYKVLGFWGIFWIEIFQYAIKQVIHPFPIHARTANVYWRRFYSKRYNNSTVLIKSFAYFLPSVYNIEQIVFIIYLFYACNIVDLLGIHNTFLASDIIYVLLTIRLHVFVTIYVLIIRFHATFFAFAVIYFLLIICFYPTCLINICSLGSIAPCPLLLASFHPTSYCYCYLALHISRLTNIDSICCIYLALYLPLLPHRFSICCLHLPPYIPHLAHRGSMCYLSLVLFIPHLADIFS